MVRVGGGGLGRLREVFTQRRKEKGAEESGRKKITITDERMRCEEGKMLLLEAFFSNQ